MRNDSLSRFGKKKNVSKIVLTNRCVIYIRVSSLGQVDSYSLQNQLENWQPTCHQIMGLPRFQIFQISGNRLQNTQNNSKEKKKAKPPNWKTTQPPPQKHKIER